MRVGMIHGHQGRRNAHENALRAFAYETVDAIFYGHSHAPRVERIPDGPLIANPGSPTQRRAQPRHSFAIATIGDGKIELTHHYFD
jgi:predicted phosphodiesterase